MKNIRYIDIHTHGAFGINFNSATYDEIDFLLKKLYEKNIRAICPTLVGDSDENIQKQLLLFQSIKQKQLDNMRKQALFQKKKNPRFNETHMAKLVMNMFQNILKSWIRSPKSRNI